jgi:DNA-binding CsgD family transcriptional regulator
MRKIVSRIMPQKAPAVLLTPRELEVLEWMASPNTYRQIGLQLNVSEETVRSHVKSILEKMKQPNRTQAVLSAMRLGLIKSGEQ